MNGTKELNSAAILGITPSSRVGCVSSARNGDLSVVGKVVIAAGVILSLGYAVSWLAWREPDLGKRDEAHKKEVQDWIAGINSDPTRKLVCSTTSRKSGVKVPFAECQKLCRTFMDSRLFNCVEKKNIYFVSQQDFPKKVNSLAACFSYPEMETLPSFVHCRATSFSIFNHSALSVCPGLPRDLEDFEISDCPSMKSMDSLNSCEKLRRVTLKGCSSISTVTLLSQGFEDVSIKQWEGLVEIKLTVSEGSRISLRIDGNTQPIIVSIIGQKPKLVKTWDQDSLAGPVIRILSDAHITDFKLNGKVSLGLFEEWNNLFALA